MLLDIRRLIVLSTLMFGLFLVVSDKQGSAQTLDFEAESALTAEVLQMKLYAKTDAEKKYCETAIQRRDQGRLPNKILYGAYRYAVEKDKDRRFIYFKKTLEYLCKRERIEWNVSDAATGQKKYFTLSKASTSTPKNTMSAPKTATNPFSALFRIFK